jgi:hypothetical protein
MKLDINKVYHQYIIKVVIFSLFLYKRQIRQPNVYKLSVISFLKKRLPWKINITIDTGIRLDKDDERNLILDQILEGLKTDYLTKVTVKFSTPLKDVTLEVDLSDETKYEKFIYS